MENLESGTYGKLQLCLDKVVSLIGAERTTGLLENFLHNTGNTEQSSSKIKLLLPYLVELSLKTFDLEEPLFYVSNIRDYRDARFCCYHLLRKYSNDTCSKIALAFQCSERKVLYGSQIAEERIQLPKFNKEFVARYQVLENSVIHFIATVN